MVERTKTMIKRMTLVLLALIATVCCSACDENQAEIVSYNVSKEADNFNVTRRITVINARTDTVLMTMVGNMSITDHENGLDVLVEVDRETGNYQKHYIYTNENTVVLVEDVSGGNVSKYKYEIEIMPQTWVPVRFTANEIIQDIDGIKHDETKQDTGEENAND